MNRLFGGIAQYLRETREELRKVTWPTREEATSLTWIVLLVTLVMAVVLGVFDFVFSQLFGLFIQ
jgi:preprotein translocase subunit SecE